MSTKTLQEEIELVQMLKSGDAAAFEILYDNYSALLYGLILRVVQDQAEAEHLLQDTFVKIWQKVATYNPSKSKFATWMMCIARNTAIDFVRSKYFNQKRKKVSLDGRDYDPNLNNKAYEIPVDALGVDNLLEKLNPTYRQILEWMYFGGYSQREIAEKYGIPIGTVKTRSRKGLIELRKFYQ